MQRHWSCLFWIWNMKYELCRNNKACAGVGGYFNMQSGVRTQYTFHTVYMFYTEYTVYIVYYNIRIIS